VKGGGEKPEGGSPKGFLSVGHKVRGKHGSLKQDEGEAKVKWKYGHFKGKSPGWKVKRPSKRGGRCPTVPLVPGKRRPKKKGGVNNREKKGLERIRGKEVRRSIVKKRTRRMKWGGGGGVSGGGRILGGNRLIVKGGRCSFPQLVLRKEVRETAKQILERTPTV